MVRVWRQGPTIRPAALCAVLAGGARYRGPSLASAHLDALGVHFLRLGHHDLQDAVLGRGIDLVGLDMGGQGDRPVERAVAPLGPVDLLSGRVSRGVPLALDCQQAVLERDLQVIGPEARQFRGYQVGVIALGNVDRGCPRLAGGPGAMLLAELAEAQWPGILLCRTSSSCALRRSSNRSQLVMTVMSFSLMRLAGPTAWRTREKMQFE